MKNEQNTLDTTKYFKTIPKNLSRNWKKADNSKGKPYD